MIMLSFQRLENQGIPPGKYANAELMKIPNFLHLTPAHIKQHCAAMKSAYLSSFFAKSCIFVSTSALKADTSSNELMFTTVSDVK